MFSRSTAPEHCTSGSDSIGRQRRFSLISRSACAGTRSPDACESGCAGAGVFTAELCLIAVRGQSALVRSVIGFDLIVEATGDRLRGIHGGIVLLRQDVVELGLTRILLVLREAGV